MIFRTLQQFTLWLSLLLLAFVWLPLPLLAQTDTPVPTPTPRGFSDVSPSEIAPPPANYTPDSGLRGVDIDGYNMADRAESGTTDCPSFDVYASQVGGVYRSMCGHCLIDDLPTQSGAFVIPTVNMPVVELDSAIRSNTDASRDDMMPPTATPSPTPDCVQYPTPTPAPNWCYRWDVSTGFSDWSIVSGVPVAGGLQSVYGDYPIFNNSKSNFVLISILPDVSATSIEVYAEYTGFVTWNSSYAMVIRNGGVVAYQWVTGNSAVPAVRTGTASVTGSLLEVSVATGTRNDGSGADFDDGGEEATLVYVQLSGTGLNPYGVSNCGGLEPAPDPTDSCVHFPTAVPVPSSTPYGNASNPSMSGAITAYDCTNPNFFDDVAPLVFFDPSLTLNDTVCFTFVPRVNAQAGEWVIDIPQIDVCIEWYSVPTLAIIGIEISWVALLASAPLAWLINSLVRF